MNYILTTDFVNSTYDACCFWEGEDTTSHIKAEGITVKAQFHPARLASYTPLIVLMLAELPDAFRQPQGASFLGLGYDKHGRQWASSHLEMERLILLGIAIDKVECTSPKILWSKLPRDMPFYRMTL